MGFAVSVSRIRTVNSRTACGPAPKNSRRISTVLVESIATRSYLPSAPVPELSPVGRASIAWATTRPALLTNWTTGFPGGVAPPSFVGVTSPSSKPWTTRSMAASRE